MRTSIFIFILFIMQTGHAEEIVLGGGCFWCTEAIFSELEGVEAVESGYAGGTLKNPTYNDICTGETGHAEVVKISYNPNKIKLEAILEVFFLTHNPTTLNRQGADVGTQYRSVVFYNNDQQKQITEQIIADLTKQQVYDKEIVTEIAPQTNYYKAENYHQDYFKNNRKQPYCNFVNQPKMEKFRKVFQQKLKK